MPAMLMKVSCTVVLLVVYMGLLTPEIEAQLTCGQVVASVVVPCLAYLRNGGSPSPQCCNGVRRLRDIANTTAIRRTVCKCLKNAPSFYRHIKPDYAARVPGKCGVNLPYKISPSTDCNRIRKY